MEVGKSKKEQEIFLAWVSSEVPYLDYASFKEGWLACEKSQA